MQIGIRFHDSQALALAERIEAIHKQGFSCAHLALSKALPDIPFEDGALTPGYAMYLKNIFSKHEVDLAVLGCYFNLADPDPMRLADVTNTYLSHIRFASVLGCGVVGTETGAPNSDYSFEEACRGEEALSSFITNLRPVVSYAEKMGVILAIEPACMHIVHNVKRARCVLDEIGSPNLQIIWDPVNLLHMDNYKQQIEVMEEAIDLLGKDIAVIHLKDYIIRDNAMEFTAPGLGQMDYGPIIHFIHERKPFIHCTLEDTKPDNAQAAREHIESLMKKHIQNI